MPSSALRDQGLLLWAGIAAGGGAGATPKAMDAVSPQLVWQAANQILGENEEEPRRGATWKAIEGRLGARAANARGALAVLLGRAVGESCSRRQEYISSIMATEEELQRELRWVIEEEIHLQAAEPRSGAPKASTGSAVKRRRSGEGGEISVRETDELKRVRAELQAALQREAARESELSALRVDYEKLSAKGELAVLDVEGHLRDTHNEELRTLTAELRKAQDEARQLAEASKEAESLRDEVDCLRPLEAKLAKSEAALAKARRRLEELTDLQETLRKEEDAHAAVLDKCIALETQVAQLPQLRKQLESAKRSKTDLEFRLHEVEQELERTRNVAAAAQHDAKSLAAGSESARAEARRLQEELQHNNGAASDATRGVDLGWTERNPEVVEEMKRLRHENALLRGKANDSTAQRVSELEDELDDSKRLLSTFQDNLSTVKLELVTAQARADELAASLDRRESSLKKLREDNNRISAELTVVRADLEAKAASEAALSLRRAELMAQLETLEEETRRREERLGAEHVQAMQAATDKWIAQESDLTSAHSAALEELNERLRVLHAAEIDRMKGEWEARQQELERSHAASLKEAEGAWESEKNTLMEMYASETECIRAEHDRAMEGHKTKWEEAILELKEKETEFSRNMKAQETDYEEQIRALRASLEAEKGLQSEARDVHAAENSRISAELTVVRADLEAKAASEAALSLRQAELMAQLETLEEETRQREERLGAEHVQAMQAATDKWIAQESDLTSAHSAALEELNERLRVLHAAEIDRMRGEWEARQQELERSHAASLKEAEGAWESEKNTLMEMYASETEGIRAERDRAMETKWEEAQAILKLRLDEATFKLKEKDAEFAQKMNSLTNQHDSQVRSLEAEKGDLQERLVQMSHDMEKAAQKMKAQETDYGDQIRVLSAKFEAEKTSHKKELAQMSHNVNKSGEDSAERLALAANQHKEEIQKWKSQCEAEKMKWDEDKAELIKSHEEMVRKGLAKLRFGKDEFDKYKQTHSIADRDYEEKVKELKHSLDVAKARAIQLEEDNETLEKDKKIIQSEKMAYWTKIQELGKKVGKGGAGDYRKDGLDELSSSYEQVITELAEAKEELKSLRNGRDAEHSGHRPNTRSRTGTDLEDLYRLHEEEMDKLKSEKNQVTLKYTSATREIQALNKTVEELKQKFEVNQRELKRLTLEAARHNHSSALQPSKRINDSDVPGEALMRQTRKRGSSTGLLEHENSNTRLANTSNSANMDEEDDMTGWFNN